MATRTRERAEFLQDVLITAVEGGTGYWAACDSYRWSDEEPEAAFVRLMEETKPGHYGGTPEDVDIDTIARGIARVLDPEFRVNAQIRQWIREGNRDNDAGMIDTDAADVIVQAALFGELRYG
jgi:hypothetical protein